MRSFKIERYKYIMWNEYTKASTNMFSVDASWNKLYVCLCNKGSEFWEIIEYECTAWSCCPIRFHIFLVTKHMISHSRIIAIRKLLHLNHPINVANLINYVHDTNTSTQAMIWKNEIIKCNYKCRCRTPTRVRYLTKERKCLKELKGSETV